MVSVPPEPFPATSVPSLDSQPLARSQGRGGRGVLGAERGVPERRGTGSLVGGQKGRNVKACGIVFPSTNRGGNVCPVFSLFIPPRCRQTLARTARAGGSRVCVVSHAHTAWCSASVLPPPAVLLSSCPLCSPFSLIPPVRLPMCGPSQQLSSLLFYYVSWTHHEHFFQLRQ